MTAVTKSLVSALSKLKLEFSDNSEKLHLAVALVFSSIFKANSIDVVIVGGQAATHWLRIDGSTDADFVATDFVSVSDTLLAVGFVKTDGFRMTHHGPNPNTEVLIELVGETIKIAGIQAGDDAVITARSSDITNQTVRELMLGDALVINPALVFLNYAEASQPDTEWHDFTDNGRKAHERALAMLTLYRQDIINRLNRFAQTGQLSKKLLRLLADEFQLNLMAD